MAINRSRNLTDELELGINERTVMVLHPDWTENLREPALERLSWPHYKEVHRSAPRKNIAESIPPTSNKIYKTPRRNPAL
jgi:hypothetical protein